MMLGYPSESDIAIFKTGSLELTLTVSLILRFLSTVALAEIWKSSYKTKLIDWLKNIQPNCRDWYCVYSTVETWFLYTNIASSTNANTNTTITRKYKNSQRNIRKLHFISISLIKIKCVVAPLPPSSKKGQSLVTIYLH